MIIAGGLLFAGRMAVRYYNVTIRAEYGISEESFGNPLMGYAPGAWHEEISEDVYLLYVDITWRELEPEERQYNWEEIARENQLERWRSEGKHLVLRFVCDIPGDEKHMDIPDWLYEKTGEAGTWYDMEYGKGFSPDYTNETLIQCHERAVKALGEYLGQDGFVAYVELGSLGHWGEWHVNYAAGIDRLPLETVREQYVLPWIQAFPNSQLLMRRPFHTAEKYGFGLYNDMAGEPEDTASWLEWISQGGDFSQTGEEHALTAMGDYWKQSPSGGEFTSSLSMEELLDSQLQRTIELLKESHTTFLGPKYADAEYEEGYQKVLDTLGYRLRISEAVLTQRLTGTWLELTWENNGIAPFYQNWPVYLYVTDLCTGQEKQFLIDMKLTELLPGGTVTTRVQIKTWRETLKGLFEAEDGVTGFTFSVGIQDPMTGKDAVRLDMNAGTYQGRTILF